MKHPMEAPPVTAGQPGGSITVALSLPLAGGVNLAVSWTDGGACTQLYRLYHRSSADSTAYLSLEAAADRLELELAEPALCLFER